MREEENQKPRVYIETFGCQMNDYDSTRMLSLMRTAGYEEARLPKEADVIIFNTCSVRDKAEQKALSRIGRLKKLRRENPNVKFVLAGCFAQRQGKALLNQMPYLNLVLGTNAIARLPEHVRRLRLGRHSIVDTEMEPFDALPAEDFGGLLPGKGSPATAFVTVMQGCNNFCAYCIVPYVRGRERSRTPQDIFTEIERLVDEGVHEITLLGQNVNSYDGGNCDQMDFTDLLHRVHAIEGLKRIRFTTSHPKDMSNRLIAAFADLPKLASHLHLPVQCGSDAVLKRMRRGYTVAHYLSLADQLRKARPDIALTSDILVGFPGETLDDQKATMDLLAQVRYSNVFSFRYSIRPGTSAEKLEDDVPEKEKIRRLMEVQDLQRAITMELHREMCCREVEVLVEKEQKKADSPRWSGKSGCYREIHFNGDGIRIGDMVTVKVEEAGFNSLRGTAVMDNKVRQTRSKP